jgi:hypothetical protein
MSYALISWSPEASLLYEGRFPILLLVLKKMLQHCQKWATNICPLMQVHNLTIYISQVYYSSYVVNTLLACSLVAISAWVSNKSFIMTHVQFLTPLQWNFCCHYIGLKDYIWERYTRILAIFYCRYQDTLQMSFKLQTFKVENLEDNI